MIPRINYLHFSTINTFPGETGMFGYDFHLLVCQVGGMWLFSMAFQMFSRNGICLVTIFIGVYLLSRI